MPAFKPEQPRPTELLNQPSLEQAQQKLKELKERANNLIIRLKSLCSGKSKITQKEISSLELSIRAIINEYTTLTSHIIYIRELTGLDNDVQKQIKEFKSESAELLRQLKSRANKNSLAGKIRRILN
jgi:archaellum component FlaC